MAERRMFAKTIVLSDAFLDMPMSARCLYFTLGMLADDDGFINSPRAIMRQCGASDDDMKLLIAKKFVLIFETGVIVIKHWRINNYLQKDRYNETKYLDEKRQLSIDQNGSYHQSMYTQGVYTQDRLGKVSIGKDNNSRFTKPTLDDIKQYCLERKNAVDPVKFYDYYESNGWKVGRNSMKDWKACVRRWERSGKTDVLPEYHEEDKPQTEYTPQQLKEMIGK